MFPTLAQHLVGSEHTPVSQILRQIASVFWDPEAWLCVHICDCTRQSPVWAQYVCVCVCTAHLYGYAVRMSTCMLL